MKYFYPEISPFHEFFLEAGDIHRVYVEQSGNPAGIPVVFLHGGPCSGTKPDHRRFFDPERYHIILLDQRGCGKSQPFGELRENSTQDLLADLELIRAGLGIRQWLLFGGSWGGTLALLYAQQFPERVLGMILRGVFLARRADMDWFLGHGVNHIYPQQWQALLDSLPQDNSGNFAQLICDCVFGNDIELAKQVAKQWLNWGAKVALGNDFQPDATELSDQDLLQARMELHYAKHDYFMAENQILAGCQSLPAIPCIIIHGQNDLTCPLQSGWLLQQALPLARLQILANAGHIARGEEMISALVAATDEMANLV
ncbi:prolyl aminopeptidase [Methylomonas paludis]|uniref:Proline iminopeptidase n=1 Tax=Methylomonas paludis TaxID=1173101 RepID=A0A975RAC8_9GAMM|nr:prolyl aminopeptidase [Methylomonas paludis]QWF71091.1 prolyl aminopeptidase [Methylomonas paludis]